jgi:hypothetical protein
MQGPEASPNGEKKKGLKITLTLKKSPTGEGKQVVSATQSSPTPRTPTIRTRTGASAEPSPAFQTPQTPHTPHTPHTPYTPRSMFSPASHDDSMLFSSPGEISLATPGRPATSNKKRPSAYPFTVTELFQTMDSFFSTPNPFEIGKKVSTQVQKDAKILKRATELQREGILTRKIAKVPEMPRNKTHWDYLLDEMVWLSTDFREERKWKIAMAKKIAK